MTSATIDRLESAALVEVLKALRAHPAVSWVERQNTGSARIGGRFVRFGWPGCSDVLACCVMADSWPWNAKARPDAYDLNKPPFWSASGALVAWRLWRGVCGVAFVARDCRDVIRELATD